MLREVTLSFVKGAAVTTVGLSALIWVIGYALAGQYAPVIGVGLLVGGSMAFRLYRMPRRKQYAPGSIPVEFSTAPLDQTADSQQTEASR